MVSPAPSHVTFSDLIALIPHFVILIFFTCFSFCGRSQLHGTHVTYETTLRGQIYSFRQELDKMMQELRETNTGFRTSFRTFGEQGNFSSEEVNVFKQVVQQLGVRIEGTETDMTAQLLSMETTNMEQAQQRIVRFDAAYVIHHRDLTLLEAQSRCMSTCRVSCEDFWWKRVKLLALDALKFSFGCLSIFCHPLSQLLIQSEVNRSNQSMADLLVAVENLRELTNNAHLYDAEFLLASLRSMSEMMVTRALYIDCVRPHNNAISGDMNRQLRNSAARQTPQAAPPPARPPKQRRRGANNGMAANSNARNQTRNRYNLHNTLPIALRGMRLVVEDWQAGRENTFVHAVTKTRLECRSNIMDAAVAFYERGYAKTTSRPDQILETIQAFMDHAQHELNLLGKEAQRYRVAAARELISVLRQVNQLMMKTIAAIFQRVTDASIGEHEDFAKKQLQLLEVGR